MWRASSVLVMALVAACGGTYQTAPTGEDGGTVTEAASCPQAPIGACPSSLDGVPGFPYGTDYDRSFACGDAPVPAPDDCTVHVDRWGNTIACCPRSTP